MMENLDDYLDRFAERARTLVDEAVLKTEKKFPDESFPVRPPYRRAVYRRFRKLKQAMNDAWKELTTELDLAQHPALQQGYARLEKQYLREYGVRTQKHEKKPVH